MQDDLTPVFSEIEQAGAIILSSPIYFGTISGQMKSFMARLLFPYSTYTDPPQSFNELLLLYVPTGHVAAASKHSENASCFEMRGIVH